MKRQRSVPARAVARHAHQRILVRHRLPKPGAVARHAHTWRNPLTPLPPPGTLCRMVAIGESVISQLRRGVLEFCVLALLRDDERYGFEIVRALSEVNELVTT